jgi:glycosyltransferase involved in cell wall biosynthesis
LTESLNGNDYYFTNSEHTRQDFLKYFPVLDGNKIFTTLLACDEKFKHCTIEQIKKSKQKYNIPTDKKYVFSLCTLEPRKNLVRAVKTFIEFIKKNNIEDMDFVLGGGAWESFIGVLEQEVPDWRKYQDKILKIGYVDDEDLAPLYSGALWFVYTSQYEGFGLPPLEAMSCGCPVITSNNSSLPEVVGNAGIMIDWDSDEQHIQAYEKYYFDENLRKEKAQKGLERAKTFSWGKCTKKMIEVMNR